MNILKTVYPWLKPATLANDILRDRREYFISKVKKPIMKALTILADRYPEPTKENCRKHNSHVLMDIWNEFFEHEDNRGREPLFRALMKLSVAEYEHDAYYSQRIDWFLEKLLEKYQSGEWWPKKPWVPAGCWTEPSAVEAYAQMKQGLAADIGIKSEVKE